jgi:hypothetical protein
MWAQGLTELTTNAAASPIGLAYNYFTVERPG